MENQGQNKEDNGILCADFDARLADVLDGVMSGAELEAFKGHAAACTDCGPLFTQAQQAIPSPAPASRPSEFPQVIRPFIGRAFATGT